jgi:hypothetical protein
MRCSRGASAGAVRSPGPLRACNAPSQGASCLGRDERRHGKARISCMEFSKALIPVEEPCTSA